MVELIHQEITQAIIGASDFGLWISGAGLLTLPCPLTLPARSLYPGPSAFSKSIRLFFILLIRVDQCQSVATS